jgi:hypothetical protein
MRILHAIVEVQQQTRNARVRVDVDPVALRQNLVILSDAGSPGGRCVTGLGVVLRIYACIPHDRRQTIEVVIMVECRFFGRATSRRCRPCRSPVVRGTRFRRLPFLLHPRKLFLQLCKLLLEGGHVVGGGLLVFALHRRQYLSLQETLGEYVFLK